MTKLSIYIPNDERQNYPFRRKQLLVTGAISYLLKVFKKGKW